MQGRYREPVSEALLIDLIHHTRRRLDSIRDLVLHLRQNPEHLPEMIDSTIEQTDSSITGLIDFLNASAPLCKGNTVNTLVEKSLKKHRVLLERKRAKVFKRLQVDLPETTVPDVPLGYIVDSLVEFASTHLSPIGTLAVVTRSSRPERGHIEILLVFTDKNRASLETRSDLQLLLVRQTVLKNRGIMDFQTSQKPARTIVRLSFPMERRRIASYAQPS